MILYHGSNLSIDDIDLDRCRPGKDFGKGFYLTQFKEQAVKMAARVARIRGGDPVINIYSVEDDFLKTPGLNILDLGREPSRQWAVFVMNNRNRDFRDYASLQCNKDNKYDIVVGPVADDDMALLFRQYENSWIDLDTMLRGMIYKKTTDQYSFHTNRALKLLRKEGIL